MRFPRITLGRLAVGVVTLAILLGRYGPDARHTPTQEQPKGRGHAARDKAVDGHPVASLARDPSHATSAPNGTWHHSPGGINGL
jgi:hypothetical protein